MSAAAMLAQASVFKDGGVIKLNWISLNSFKKSGLRFLLSIVFLFELVWVYSHQLTLTHILHHKCLCLCFQHCKSLRSLLTKPLAGPPVWLLESGELNIGVQPESVVQVRRATLWLTDDIKIWKAAHAVCFSIAVDQVFSKSVPQLLEHCAKALRVVRVQVCPVRI